MAGWRSRRQGAPLLHMRRPQWADVLGLFHMRLNDAAAELNVSSTYLRRLCRKNGIHQWPGKKVRRYRVMLKVDAQDGSPWAGLAGPSQLAKVAETQTQTQKEDEDKTTTHKPVVNHPPREELVTLNLIEKVGSSCSSVCN